MLTQPLKILQYVNIGITFVFLFVYIYRLFHLRHFAVTGRQASKYPKARILLCAIYVILSVPFLVLCIKYGSEQSDDTKFWVIEEGVGECVDSIILVMQLAVLRQQLIKQRPYTPTHLLYCIYLTLISLTRFIVILIITDSKTTSGIIFQAFYLTFLINSVLLLGYWIAKRQQLPQFEDNKYFSFQEFQAVNSSRYQINKNIEISYLRKISESFNYIRPSVSVEKNRFRIVLEIYELHQLEETQLTEKQRKQSKFEENSQEKKQIEKKQIQKKFLEKESEEKKQIQKKVRPSNIKSNPSLKIISNRLYSNNQILEMYKLCGRFNIAQKLHFDSNNLGEMYKNLQNYLDQLFANKKHYLGFVLKFFEVTEDYEESCQRQLRETIKGSEFDMFSHIDGNATIMSLRVYKQLWMDDYYLFYIDALALEARVESRPMKRYTDFETFHENLISIIKRRYNNSYALPNLPKKYLFNWDETIITQRRNQLQKYLRSLTNDEILMTKLHEIREATTEFLGFQQVFNLFLCKQEISQFYFNLQITKGNIGKQLRNNQYITFYEFHLTRRGIPVKSIKKRFNDFVELHENLQRWMKNTQISYKLIVLPQKHLYKSAIRHDKLKAYLKTILEIKQIWRVYEVNVFFGVGSNGMKDLSLSRIQSNENQYYEENQYNERRMQGSAQEKFIDQSSFSSKQRMSALIDQLGD